MVTMKKNSTSKKTNIKTASQQRIQTIKETSEEHRRAFAQHFTPKETALLAVSMFSPTKESICCLDLGAGTGMLSVALAERYGKQISQIDCIEADATLAPICNQALGQVNHNVIIADALLDTPKKQYERIILNPPYKKMSPNDPRQKELPVPSPNLYSAFLSIAISRLSDNGEVVAIIPRSWTNGSYFSTFRKWALSQCSLDAMHIYDSRSEVFQDTDVLQEIMIVRFSKRVQSPTVKVSSSSNQNGEINVAEYAYDTLVQGDGKIVRIAPSEGKTSSTIEDSGYCPSTGKVVDFRATERIYNTHQEALNAADKSSDIYPLVYAGNMKNSKLEHPATIGKPQWFRADDEKSVNQLIPAGSYVFVKRFTSKEETKRVVAFPIAIDKPLALENHMSFIHSGTPRKVIPLSDKVIAQGISIWLNSSYIDNWFRDMSGSTQVNAKDIKAMPCPDKEMLLKLGKRWTETMSQNQIDKIVKELIKLG